ncbi:MAG: hypothetical protein JWM49_1840 [Microbacteriaceae bacterium]|nr:hypothetical protein [Microbacteriaceae bacterium]
MSNDTPTSRPNPYDGPDIDGKTVPPEETADAAAFAPEHVTPVETLVEDSPVEKTPVEATEPPVVYDLVEVAPAEPSATEPVIPTEDPAAAVIPAAVPAAESVRPADDEVDSSATENQYGIAPLAATSAASVQSIYVPAPVEPRRKGNRGIGVLIAVVSAVIFAGLYALLLAIVLAVSGSGFRFDFLTSQGFYIPVLFFLVGFVVVALIVNRASWWAFVLGSLFVALFVYFGTIATGLIIENIGLQSPSDAARMFGAALASPLVIAAALLAREVSMWMGAVISARGRRVRAKNADAQAEFDRESAARIAEMDTARFRESQAAV